MFKFLTLIILAVSSFSANAAGLGFNPFDRGSPTSAGGVSGARPSNPSAPPSPPKATPVPAANPLVKPDIQAGKPPQTSQQNKK